MGIISVAIEIQRNMFHVILEPWKLFKKCMLHGKAFLKYKEILLNYDKNCIFDFTQLVTVILFCCFWILKMFNINKAWKSLPWGIEYKLTSYVYHWASLSLSHRLPITVYLYVASIDIIFFISPFFTRATISPFLSTDWSNEFFKK